MKKGWLIALGAVGLIVLVSVMIVIGKRNSFVAAQETIEANWAQVENVLQRRGDLIPNLVETVKGYAKQERDIFIQVAEARAKLAGAATREGKIEASQNMDAALGRLLLIVERYPELKSNQNFLALQDELAGTENRIAVERRRYNESIRAYNIMIRQFPGTVVASMFGFEKVDAYYQPPEASMALPAVQF